MRRIALPWIALALFLTPALGAQGLNTSHLGYADLDALEQALGSTPSINLNFDQAAVRSLASLVSENNPQLTELADGVDFVRARVFDLEEGRTDDVLAAIDQTADDLKAQGWAPLVSVKGESERAYVLMRLDGDLVAGLVAAFADHGDAGFVHVMGKIDPAQVMSTFMQNQDAMRKMFTNMKGESGADVEGDEDGDG